MTRRCCCRTRGIRGTAKLFAFLGFAAVATTSGGHAATLGRLDGERHARRDPRARRRARRPRPTSRSASTSRTGSPTIRRGVAANVAPARARPAWPVARSRTSPAAPTTRSTRPRVAAERVAAAAEAAHGSGPRLVADRARARTSCTAAPTSPTRSPGCRRTRPRAPTCSTRPGMQSARRHPLARRVGRSPGQRARAAGHADRSPSSARSACGASRSAAASAASPSARRSTRRASSSTQGTYGFWSVGRVRGTAPRRVRLIARPSIARPRPRQSCAIATAGAPLVSPAAEPPNGEPEREHATVAGDEPVAAALRLHADDGGDEVDAPGRAVELRVAEREDPAVARDDPVALARRRRRHPDHRAGSGAGRPSIRGSARRRTRRSRRRARPTSSPCPTASPPSRRSGWLRCWPPVEPWKRASPNEKIPPSRRDEPVARCPTASRAMPTIGLVQVAGRPSSRGTCASPNEKIPPSRATSQ